MDYILDLANEGPKRLSESSNYSGENYNRILQLHKLHIPRISLEPVQPLYSFVPRIGEGRFVYWSPRLRSL